MTDTAQVVSRNTDHMSNILLRIKVLHKHYGVRRTADELMQSDHFMNMFGKLRRKHLELSANQNPLTCSALGDPFPRHHQLRIRASKQAFVGTTSWPHTPSYVVTFPKGF